MSNYGITTRQQFRQQTALSALNQRGEISNITLNNTANQGADFPEGGMLFILNYGTGSVNITGSGVTVFNPHLGTTGNRTVAGNSVATLLKYSSTSWFVWGTNVT